jgi:hypothetical protein
MADIVAKLVGLCAIASAIFFGADRIAHKLNSKSNTKAKPTGKYQAFTFKEGVGILNTETGGLFLPQQTAWVKSLPSGYPLQAKELGWMKARPAIPITEFNRKKEQQADTRPNQLDSAEQSFAEDALDDLEDGDASATQER